MKAIFADTIIAESDDTIVIEGNHYFHPQDVQTEYLTNRKEADYICSWKGEADYYDIKVGDKVAEHSVWTYPNPKPAAKEIAGYFAFEPAVKVQ